LILKIQETVQDLTRTVKREQERFKTQQSYTASPFHKATSSPLHNCKEFHYKMIKLDQFTEKQLAPRK